MPPLVSPQLPTQMQTVLNQLRLSRILCDCKILLRSSSQSPTDASIQVHRLVLAAVSPYFCQLFAQIDDTSTSSVLDLSAYPPDTVKTMIEFIYTGELNLSRSDPTKMLTLANQCQIGALQSILVNVSPASEEQLRQEHSTPDRRSRISKRPMRMNSPNTDQPTEVPTASAGLSSLTKRFCPKHFLINCLNCVTTSTSSTDASQVSSTVYQPTPTKFIPPTSLLDLPSIPIPELLQHHRSPSQQLAANVQLLRNSWLTHNLLSPILSASQQSIPQPSPLSSGIHSGPTETPTFSGSKKCRSQGVRTSPGSSTPQRMIKDEDAGWCRNKKYIERVNNGYMCTVCGKVYGRYNSVSYHVTIYHRNPPIQCDQPGCQFSTREARYIHFHRYYRHGTPLPSSIDLTSRSCPFCRHVSKSPAMLEKHIRRHEEQDHTLESPSSLQNGSSRIRSVEETYGCDQCSFRTRTEDQLAQHKLFRHSLSLTPSRRHSNDPIASGYNKGTPCTSNVEIKEEDEGNSSDTSSRIVMVDGDSDVGGIRSSSGPSTKSLPDEVPLDLSPTAAPPPSRCVSDQSGNDVSKGESIEESVSSLDDEHSQLAATHTTGYHSMVNYGTV